MKPRTPAVGGNWKMNTDLAGAVRLAREVAAGVAELEGVEVSLFPPFPYFLAVGEVLAAASSGIRLGAQDFYFKPDGAFTGEVSLSMLKDCGVRIVLAGHSERRHVIGESGMVAPKTAAALAAGFECVLCVGETLEQRLGGLTDEVNGSQLRTALAGVPSEAVPRLTIAYEPVWAIGTGRTASPDDAQDAHVKIRNVLAGLYSTEVAESIRILYGGSVKASNALELFSQPDVDGGLIGGASLNAAEFVGIVRAASRAKLHP